MDPDGHSSSQFKHSFVPTNGILMHIAETGTGPVVLLLHGFPEIWYSWRHQMIGLAQAGFRAIAPDHRGYGLTQITESTDKQQDYVLIAKDIIGLLDALGEDKVFVVGKDWATFLVYILGFLHPDRVKGLVVLGLPFSEPPKVATFRDVIPEGHYIRRWARRDRAENDFSRLAVATVIRRIYTLFSKSDMPIARPEEHLLDLVKATDPLPSWMKEGDLQIYAAHYEKSGFEIAMEVPYRSYLRTVEKLSCVTDFAIRAPLLVVIAECDYVTKLKGTPLNLHEAKFDLMPNCKIVFIKEGTHFVQEQFPAQVNDLLVEFFTPLTSH